ncbi:zinc-dependent alcohol dehydrogenase family protein [Alkalicoccus chagannorensis]|uniref:zinc-dependent alcohol dehydrogenase family protein n=1 Tax=Alkalicoccus chagannorensis TaxID=427072 RepID=UPI000685F96D|nr:NAD(P)-dependent alcohol dehydrogenase [Alkalicoccus chagannorensis]
MDNRVYRTITAETPAALKLEYESIPEPQRGEVLIRVHATSLNYRDYAILQGMYPGGVKDGVVPLSDGAGEIIALGEEVHRFQKGDRVVGNFMKEFIGSIRPDYLQPYGTHSDGWLTDYKVVHQEQLTAVPEHLTMEEAATLPCAAVTAWNGLQGPSPLTAGDTVLTLGTGGVSIFTVQLANALGIRTVSTTSADWKAERLKELGAGTIINYKETPSWGEKAAEAGRGVDRVLEVGGPATIKQSLAALRPGGEAVLIGVLSTEGDDISYFDLFGGANIRSVFVGSRDDFERMNNVIHSAGIRPVIDRTFRFDEAPEAFQYLAEQKHIGKIVITHA